MWKESARTSTVRLSGTARGSTTVLLGLRIEAARRINVAARRKHVLATNAHDRATAPTSDLRS
jgi:hypothetical protein